MAKILETYVRQAKDGQYLYFKRLKCLDTLGRTYWMNEDDFGTHRKWRMRADTAEAHIALGLWVKDTDCADYQEYHKE